MSAVTFVVPGRLDALTGGYGYDRRTIAGLRGRGWLVTVCSLDDSFPRPTLSALEGANRELETIPDNATVVVDGLALGAMPDVAQRHASRLRLVALVHHPLAEETGLSASLADQLLASERRALATVRAVVVTSEATARALGKYGVSRDRIRVVEPGTDPAPLAKGSRDGVFHLLCVAALVPRKGHEILLQALSGVSDRNWCLTCVGSTGRDQTTTERLRGRALSSGLMTHVRFVGELEGAALAAQYDRADAFVLATLHEGYGMAVAEALACGLPVVATSTGAIPELLGSGAGLLVAPGDAEGFAQALARVMGDARLRGQLAEGARLVRMRLPTWDTASETMAGALEKVAREEKRRIPVP
jgi:glycosyltransferase involved in cell wall biosynthesis